MPQQYLHIELNKEYTLNFKIHNTPIADLWLERMNLRHPYPIDHPDRFYGFDSQEQEIARAEKIIQGCIDTINAYQPIIEQPFTNVYDQDCLNYMHNIFERYHGLLNQQTTAWWLEAPEEVKKALADLNIAVHRCENSSRLNLARFVCTWYGMPKDVVLSEQLMKQYGELSPSFGSVCLNYAEIGKTLFDLASDNDKYISDDAFRPFDHYSADFVVRFFEIASERIDTILKNMQNYHQAHGDFFNSRGLGQFDHVKLQPLHFPVARLIETTTREQLFKDVQQRQYVTKVYINETMHNTNT